MEVRLLKASEIEVRVQSITKGDKGAILLLYKDARVDMNILDEIVGPSRWQRHHELIDGKLFCNVGINFPSGGINNWVWKQDVGTESYTEKEKGQASDSFKRACFNWGIGRELYTSPFIWVNNMGDISNGKCYTKFKVTEIGYSENREINHLIIIDDKSNVRFKQIANTKTKAKDEDLEEIRDNSLATDPQLNLIYKLVKEKNYGPESMASYIKKSYGKDSSKELTKKEASELIEMLNGM